MNTQESLPRMKQISEEVRQGLIAWISANKPQATFKTKILQQAWELGVTEYEQKMIEVLRRIDER